MLEEKKKLVLDFIRKHTVAVVASVNTDGKPEAAAIEFSETENLEIIFDTFATYRKYKNLQANPRVAFVIGWDEDITVQYEGVARELKGDERAECQNIHLAKLPGSAKFANLEVIRYFKVIPTWIRYADLAANPWEMFEIKF